MIVSFTTVKGQDLRSLYIIDADSKIPIPDVLVANADLSIMSFTDESGSIRIKWPLDSSQVFSFSRIGYESKNINVRTLNSVEGNLIFLDKRISSLREIKLSSLSNNRIFKNLSELDIHLRPVNSSQEVLKMVPGLFIGQHAGGGKAEQIFLRGFDLDHGTDINLSVDGLPVNMVSHAHGQGYADLHFVIPELIEKVSFSKGPYFADKGNFTTAGFVEFKTKDFLENNFLKLDAGQFNSVRGVTGINLLSNKTSRIERSLYFAGEGSFTKGFFKSSQDFSRFNAALKYYGPLNGQNSLTAAITGFTSKWNASGQIPDRAFDSGIIDFYGAIDDTEGGKTSRYNVNIELTTKTKNGAVIRNQLFYTKYLFELYSNFTYFKVDPVNGDQIRQKENRNIFGYNSSFKRDFLVGKIHTVTKAGIQIRYDDVNGNELTRTKNREINTADIMLGDVDEYNAAAYWTQEFFLTKKLIITGALRADYFKNIYKDDLAKNTSASSSTILSPKLNIDYIINSNVQLYLYNGRGFHSNDTRVAVKQNGRKVLPPAYGADLGTIFKIGKRLIVQSAIWYLWLDQEFIYVGDEGVVEAGGQTQRFGIDISGRYELSKHLYADLDLTLAKARAKGVKKAVSYLPLAPGMSSAGGITYRKQSGFNGSLRYRFMDDRPANEDNSVVAKGYFIADAAINYSKKNWEAGITIQNIFNVKWKETQFNTESKLRNEIVPVTEIHFTPGTPFFAKAILRVNF